ncbi:MAG: DedA family protein [Candidatus Komeilibacteria bacterium]|nr:DedA family protein [Candidatus Komeilibacteria bacterium]
MGLTLFLAGHVTNLIHQLGLEGIFFLMITESMFLPTPSEAIMPFAGFLIANGQFTFFGVILFSTLGSLIGSLISYYIGQFGGRPFVEKFGKYFLLNREDLAKTEKYFNQRGEITIFISRFIPVIRHLISLPAGLAKMNLFKFCLYTILGAGLWNTFLAVVGFYLKQNWEQIIKYSEALDLLVLAAIIIGIAWFFKKHLNRKSKP